MAGGNTDTRQRLIDTSIDLIWQSSYGSVSVDDICKAAGVKKGSFYHFFPSKVDLAVAAMEECAECVKDSIGSVLAKNTAMERLDAFAEMTLERQSQAAEKYGHVCGCPLASLGSEMACQEDTIRNKFEDLRRQQAQFYEALVKDFIAEGHLSKDTDAKEEAQKLYSYVMGVLTMARIENDLKLLKRDLKPGMLQMLGVKTKKTKAA
jgi:TetR/AcrR family transcriptional repressor of nem operon